MTPQQKALEGRQAYTAVLNVLSDMRESGLIDDKTKVKIEAIRVVASDALNQLEIAATTNQSNFQTAFNLFSSALDQLMQYTKSAQPKKVGMIDGPERNFIATQSLSRRRWIPVRSCAAA